MLTVTTRPGVAAQQVDDFPKDCPRSSKGSFHFRPSSTLMLNEEEYAHLAKKHPALAAAMLVVDDGKRKFVPLPPVKEEALATPEVEAPPKAKNKAKSE
jgi:hypothetical protein